MILTVTMNPSIDTSYQLNHLAVDDVNRVVAHKTAGGKGLNVSRVLRQLDAEVLATGLLGGHMGEFLADRMDDDGIQHSFTTIAGESRVCIAVLHDGNQTEFLEAGPCISEGELDIFTAHFRELVARDDCDCVTLSGSLPKGVPADYYALLVHLAQAAEKPVLLDTSGAALTEALAAPVKPTLIKPNLSEINALLTTSFTPDEVAELQAALASDARFADIAWVVVTMGGAGAVAFIKDQAYRVQVPAIPAVNATGSGDSTVAGFAYAIAQGMACEDVLRWGMTCGKLNAMDPQTGHLVLERFDEVFSGIEVVTL
ncbi:hexose kinase [Collinsella sp. zg1085]|uniref:hexose kinase n=1 Tax=Collinsella sp. zg1085 TaxID=2844380 RepID=UPI001C0AC992|nr:hexose kinase [Collinsella sp. zg1085]QWT17443.1 hexose kinase [Collinsella sp. zg1085]